MVAPLLPRVTGADTLRGLRTRRDDDLPGFLSVRFAERASIQETTMAIKYKLVAVLLLSLSSAATAQPDPFERPSQKARKRVQKPALPPPTEVEMGVPQYPGARFDGDVSGGMSGSDQKIWVFFSDDAVTKVVAFYQQKTGKKATEWEKDKYMIPLRGDSGIPEHGVTVETLAGNPLFEGKGKTIISVTRRTNT